MPVTADRKFLLDINGQTVVLSAEEMQAAKTETTVTITCAGPKCQARHQRPEPFSVTWVEEEVAKDPLKLPDPFFSMIKMAVNPTKPEELVFCGPQCVRDFLQYSYIPPQPPRIALENARKEQEKQLETLNPHLIAGDAKAEYHTTQKPPVTLPPHSGDTLKVVRLTDNGHTHANGKHADYPQASCSICPPTAPSPESDATGYVDQESDVHV